MLVFMNGIGRVATHSFNFFTIFLAWQQESLAYIESNVFSDMATRLEAAVSQIFSVKWHLLFVFGSCIRWCTNYLLLLLKQASKRLCSIYVLEMVFYVLNRGAGADALG